MPTALLSYPPMRLAHTLAACLLLACSSEPEPDPDPKADEGSDATSVRQTIGPEGGSIVVRGATVTIPQGALAEATAITISASDAAPFDDFVVLSKVFLFQPSGIDFARPVTLEIPFTNDAQPSSMWWASSTAPTFEDVGGEARGGKMIATVMHFSSGFVGRKNEQTRSVPAL